MASKEMKNIEDEFEEQISFFDDIFGLNETTEDESDDNSEVEESKENLISEESIENEIIHENEEINSNMQEDEIILAKGESTVENENIVENVENENLETEISFEDALSELDKIVQELQRSDIALDKSMELFRRGTTLVQSSRKQLSEAEQEVKELLANGEEVDFE